LNQSPHSTTSSEGARRARGYAIGLVSALVLSTTAILIRHLTERHHMPPLVLACWRDGLVALTLLPVLGLLRPALLRPGLLARDAGTGRRHLPYLAAYGLVLAGFNALWTHSVALNGAAISTVLVYSSAAFTALLGRWLLCERLDSTKGVAVALSLGGCVLVSGALDTAVWSANPGGIMTGILSGLGYAAYSLLGRAASERKLNPWSTLLYTFGFAALFLLALNLSPVPLLPGVARRPADLFWLGRSASGWAVLLTLAAGPTLLGFGLYNVSLGYLPASVANLIVTLEPVFTAILAYLAFGERLSGVQIAGSALILSGVALLRLREQREKRTSPHRKGEKG
jgi:drug/metabolite transporter (DMT)-like permease